jgi:hypothetical protein
MDFPQYRRYSNNLSWFKILDDRHFIELQFIGDKVLQHTVTAHQYPEMLRIQDMLRLEIPGLEVLNGELFEEKLIG